MFYYFNKSLICTCRWCLCHLSRLKGFDHQDTEKYPIVATLLFWRSHSSLIWKSHTVKIYNIHLTVLNHTILLYDTFNNQKHKGEGKKGGSYNLEFNTTTQLFNLKVRGCKSNLNLPKKNKKAQCNNKTNWTSETSSCWVILLRFKISLGLG